MCFVPGHNAKGGKGLCELFLNWSAAAMYSASLCSEVAARHDESPLELGSRSIERA